MDYHTAGTGLALAPSSISRTVTKLVDKSLIQRRRLLSDRRVVILTLTEEGMALTQDLHRRVQAFDAMLSEGVSAQEMAVFTSVTSKVMANYASLAQSKSFVVKDDRRVKSHLAQVQHKLGTRRAAASRPIVSGQAFSKIH